jgi:hypothetical protein
LTEPNSDSHPDSSKEKISSSVEENVVWAHFVSLTLAREGVLRKEIDVSAADLEKAQVAITQQPF